MAKLIVVPREQAEGGRLKLEALLEKDTEWQEEKRQNERDMTEEKSRRDSEHRAQQAEARTQRRPLSRPR